jgi:2-polyprenyl-6-methoxyphenol hydroxylase-like FAD-dependent oxidoreductase
MFRRDRSNTVEALNARPRYVSLSLVMRVLISGAGIAGPTLAYWLAHYGFEPNMVDTAPALRTGGYVIDFRRQASTSLIGGGCCRRLAAVGGDLVDNIALPDH